MHLVISQRYRNLQPVRYDSWLFSTLALCSELVKNTTKPNQSSIWPDFVPVYSHSRFRQRGLDRVLSGEKYYTSRPPLRCDISPCTWQQTITEKVSSSAFNLKTCIRLLGAILLMKWRLMDSNTDTYYIMGGCPET